MRQLLAHELKVRARAPGTLVVCVTRRRRPQGTETVRSVGQATEELGLPAAVVEAVGIDADDVEARPLLLGWRVRYVPEVLVIVDGVVVDRAVGGLDLAAARALLRVVP